MRLRGTTLVDFESRSRCNLGDRGGRNYWSDPSSEALVAVCWNLDSNRAVAWYLGDEPLRLDVAVAHNASTFDRFAAAASGWYVDVWKDSAAAARRSGLPGKLAALGGDGALAKDKEGSRFTKGLSRPSRRQSDAGELPPLTPAVMARVTDYCVSDVRIMRDAWDDLEPWFDVDADVEVVDRVVNDRGIRIDLDLVSALEVQVDRLQDKAVRRAAKALGWKRSKVRAAAMSPVKLAAETGLPNAQAATLEEAARAKDAHPLIAARQALASIAGGKLAAIRNLVSPDGRLRDSLKYYGAHTGRWSGRGFQPHNLPRDSFEKEAEAADCSVADYTDSRALAALQGDDLTKKEIQVLLRGLLVADPGHVLIAYDWSGIEARCNAWAARDESALDVFRAFDAKTGPDPYKVMAATIFGVDVAGVDKLQRQIGKAAELGCFGPDTLVLTRTGYRPIIEVTTEDQVWDGVDWVKHAGVIDQGIRPTTNLRGVTVTPEHPVLCGNTWEPAASLADRASMLFQALETGSAACSSLGMNSDYVAGCPGSRCGAIAVPRNTSSIPRISAAAAPSHAPRALARRAPRRSSIGGGTPTCVPTTTTACACSTESPLRSEGVTTRRTGRSRITAAAASGSSSRGAATGGGFWRTFSRYAAGMFRRLTSTESTTTAGTARGICASCHMPKTSRTGEPSSDSRRGYPVLRRVYDIALAGPRNRFVILTDAGPLVVHNCGYQMGGPKFAATAEKAGTDLAAMGVSSDAVVKAWRKLHAPIVRLWYATQDAFAAACEGRIGHAGPWTYEPLDGGHVACFLPSGRPIVYRNAEARRTVKYGRPAWDLTYTNPTKGFRVHAYGGMFVENAVQATCRDLLADALVRSEKAGLRPTFHVHDELVNQVRDSEGREGEAETLRIMKSPPSWAKGLPIKLDGFRTRRYRK